MLFSGTAVANGSCSAVVTGTGMSTEMGRIQADIQAAAAEDADTPLKKKLNDFGNLLAQVRAGRRARRHRSWHM
jgi:P-type Ca2+ transporter type 2C